MEDKIKFYEIANILDLDLEYDGDETDLRLHGRKKLNWGAETSAAYEEATNAIDAISYKGNGWEVYATYDVSGFDYWMMQQEEPNYINMTIMFDNDTIDATEIPAIKNAMDMAYSDAYSIAEKYDYVPNSEYKRGGKVDGRSTRAKSTWNSGASWTRDRNAYNKSEDWEKPMNKRKYAEGGGVGETLTGLAWYMTFDSAGSDYDDIYNNTQSQEEFDNYVEEGKILAVYPFVIEVENQFQIIRKISEYVGNEDEGTTILGYRLDEDKNGGYSDNLPYNDNDEYKRGGKVDGRSTRAKDTWNSGASWTRDRNAYNKSENWEKPLNQRGKTVSKSVTKSSSSASSKSSSSASSKGKSKNYSYIPNYMIRGAEVNNSGKTTDIDGANILDGIYVKAGTKYAEGGGLDLFVTPKGRNVEYKGKSGGIYKYKWVDMPSEYSKVISGNGQFKNKINPIVADEMIDSMITNYNKFKDEKYAEGGGVGNGYMVFNYTDNLYASNDIFATKKEANNFISQFRKRFEQQGYYRDSNMNKIDIDDIDLLVIDESFNPFRYAEGGGVPDLDKKMALINLDMIHEYSVKLDNIVTEETELEEWVKMKLTRIEQNVADVKHAVSGGEKFDGGGMIFKKQLLHISKYAKELIDMLQSGSNLMGWQENKLAIAADNIDGIYHYMDYLENKNKKISDEYLPFAEGGGVGAKKSKKQKAIDLLVKNIKYSFVNTDMGSGWKFVLYAPFSTSGYGKDVLEEMKYLDSFDAEDMGIEDWDNLSKKDKDYYYNDWKNDLFDSSFESFKNKVIPKHLYFFEEELQKDEYKNGGNVGRDWIFKSKQKWEQDYDRKREYKEYKKEGWLSNWFKEGGEAKNFDFDGFRKRQAIISEAVKFAFVRAIGFDDAYNLLQNEDLSISPYRLVERAVSGEFIGVHEINKDVVESAIDEARRVTGRYKDSGQGIGSSDMTAFLKNFLDDAGFKTAFISSRLERIDENGNAIKVKSDLPNTTMFKDGGSVKFDEISEYVKKIRENRKAKGLGEMTQKEHSDLINELQEKFNKYAKGGRVKNYKYVPNHMIESVDVERNGKTTEIDGGNILDGLYVKGKVNFEEGGYVENIPTETLEAMIGRKLNGWNDNKVIFNGIVYKKCFMKPYYKIA